MFNIIKIHDNMGSDEQIWSLIKYNTEPVSDR